MLPAAAPPAFLPEAANLDDSESIPSRKPASLSLFTFSFVFSEAPALPARNCSQSAARKGPYSSYTLFIKTLPILRFHDGSSTTLDCQTSLRLLPGMLMTAAHHTTPAAMDSTNQPGLPLESHFNLCLLVYASRARPPLYTCQAAVYWLHDITALPPWH